MNSMLSHQLRSDADALRRADRRFQTQAEHLDMAADTIQRLEALVRTWEVKYAYAAEAARTRISVLERELRQTRG